MYILCGPSVRVATSRSLSCNAFHYLLDNIFLRFDTKLYKQIVSIPMDINRAAFVSDFFFVLL